MEIRISLTAEQFAELIAGKVIEVNGVKIILQDIGYTAMLSIIEKQIRK